MSKPRVIYPVAYGAYDSTKNEHKDCVVRAFANVTGKSYEESHSIFKKGGRLDGRSTPFKVLINVLTKQNFKFKTFGNGLMTNWLNENYSSDHVSKGMTLYTMLKKPEFQKGKYFCLMSGHAFAVIDGKVYDQLTIKSNSRISSIFTLD